MPREQMSPSALEAYKYWQTHWLSSENEPKEEEEKKSEKAKNFEIEKEREREREIETNPLAKVDVELVEGDVSNNDEDFLDEGIDSMENGEVEKLRALLVQIWH